MGKMADTVEREHDLEKASFFGNAKKTIYLLQRKIIYICINKLEHLKTLEIFKFLMLKDSLFFK